MSPTAPNSFNAAASPTVTSSASALPVPQGHSSTQLFQCATIRTCFLSTALVLRSWHGALSRHQRLSYHRYRQARRSQFHYMGVRQKGTHGQLFIHKHRIVRAHYISNFPPFRHPYDTYEGAPLVLPVNGAPGYGPLFTFFFSFRSLRVGQRLWERTHTTNSALTWAS